MVKRKSGGQLGNTNAMKHGAFSKRFLPDSPQGHMVRYIEAQLSVSFPDPTPQQILILKRAAVKAFRCDRLEREILRLGAEASESLQAFYLRWAKELRADLKILGLERRTKNVTDLALELMPSRKQSL